MEKLSKFISLLLRHKPEIIGLTLDRNGWANVNELVNCINNNNHKINTCFNISQEDIRQVVQCDNKKRYSFNDDHTLIRANQGHSIDIDLQLKSKRPPNILYHGTPEKFTNSINIQGLTSQKRHHVHLSEEYNTAFQVGLRRGRSVVYVINAKKMYCDGITFFISENGVWLVDYVAPKYFKYILRNGERC